MSTAKSDATIVRKPLRLWPGVTAAVLLVLLRYVLPLVAPDAGLVSVMGGLAAALAVVLWWLFFSRAAWTDRGLALAVMAGALAATPLVLHESIAGGAMGMLFFISAVPALCVAFVVWAWATRSWASRTRRLSMVATIVIACAAWSLVRTEGIRGGGGSDLRWRWSPTAEERLLARTAEEPIARLAPAPVAGVDADAGEPKAPETAEEDTDAPAAEPARVAPAATAAVSPAAAAPVAPAVVNVRAEWPGFRGRDRNAVVPGLRIATNWSSSPPVEVWRRPVGPGWSSFAVRGDAIYTQEQRGEHEVVACHRLSTGELVWRHADTVRFWESNGGAGPRATPAVSGDRVYTLGATGLVNALDARTGALVWSRDAAADTGAKLPGWGFAGSPLVIDDLVVVAASGALVAYEAATGSPRWVRPPAGGGYSSPQLVTIAGTPQIVFLHGSGATGVAPVDGQVLWDYEWPGAAIVQPAVTGDGDLLVSTGDAMGGMGLRRLGVSNGPGGWTVRERWTSRGLKPYFNDYVVHDGHAYGFDGRILSCISLEDGERRWKGGRYGHGQLVLLRDQGVLLVLSEDGELALVQASPDGFTELARVPAIDGKTWNHPALAGDLLLVRNGEEMAAFRLPVSGR